MCVGVCACVSRARNVQFMTFTSCCVAFGVQVVCFFLFFIHLYFGVCANQLDLVLLWRHFSVLLVVAVVYGIENMGANTFIS